MTLIRKLIERFNGFEYRHTYADTLLDSYLATQIQVLRERHILSQEALAFKAKLHQSQVSRLEDVNHSAWTIKTLRKLARAFDLRLVVRFEEFGSVIPDIDRFGRASLDRRPFAEDPAFQPASEVRNDATPISDVQTVVTMPSFRLLYFPARSSTRVPMIASGTRGVTFNEAIAK